MRGRNFHVKFGNHGCFNTLSTRHEFGTYGAWSNVDPTSGASYTFSGHCRVAFLSEFSVFSRLEHNSMYSIQFLTKEGKLVCMGCVSES